LIDLDVVCTKKSELGMSRQKPQQLPPVLAVIPARGGSKGIPNKNIAPLGGRPLLEYTVNSARQAELIADVIVSTDSEQIANVATSLGAAVPFIRPSELATDDARSVDVVLHSLDFMEQFRGINYEAVAMLQPTTPFRAAGLIDRVIRSVFDNGADSATTVVNVGANHPHRMYTLDEKFHLKPLNDRVFDHFLPRQSLPPVYLRSGDVYVTRSSILRGRHELLGDSVVGVEVPASTAINIDESRDLAVAELLLKKGL